MASGNMWVPAYDLRFQQLEVERTNWR